MLGQVGDHRVGVGVGVFERHLLGEERRRGAHDAGVAFHRHERGAAFAALVDVALDDPRSVRCLELLGLRSLAGEFLAADPDLGAVGVEALEAFAGRLRSQFVERGLQVQFTFQHRSAGREAYAQRHRSVSIVFDFSGHAANDAHIKICTNYKTLF